MSERLSVFTDGVDIVIASDPVDATDVWESITCRDHRYRGDDTMWRVIPENEPITVWVDPEAPTIVIPQGSNRTYDDDGFFITAEARNWLEMNWKGVLSSLL